MSDKDSDGRVLNLIGAAGVSAGRANGLQDGNFICQQGSDGVWTGL